MTIDPAAHPAAGRPRQGNWNLPNVITLVRILLAPLFVWMLLVDPSGDGALRWWATVLFVLAIATDGLDGAIARSRGLVTDLGKLLDPIADKVLIGGALISLSILGELPWWVTILILVREVGITVYRFVVISDGVVAASRGGKLKTVVQAVAISAALAPLWVIAGFTPWIYWFDGILMTAAVVLTVATGLEYLWHAWQAARARRSRTA